MTIRVVIDTNIWIRILLKGRVTLPVLESLNQDRFQLVISQPLMEELHLVTATEYSLIWRMLDLLGFPGLALYLILGKTAVLCLGMMIYGRMNR